MTGSLIDSARILSDDDAGGQGGCWKVVMEPASLLEQWLARIRHESRFFELGSPAAVDE